MKTVLPLNSNWKLSYSEHMAGEKRGFPKTANTDAWFAADVPGDVHLDLVKAGLIPEPFFGTNFEHCIWMEEKDWWYRTSFHSPAKQESQSVFLLFEGLDTFATVYLNGEKIGTQSNMFIPLSLEVTKRLQSGLNELAVCLASPIYSAPVKMSPSIGGFAPRRLFTRKAQACYGWDIAPRLVTIGIWRPVKLIVCDELEIANSWIRTKKISKGSAELEVEVEVVKHKNFPGRAILEIEVAGKKKSLPLRFENKRLMIEDTFFIKDAPLWWPYNHGSPSLQEYSLTITLNEVKIDQESGIFGIRTVELIQEPQGEGKTSFYFKINGKPIFLKGMNWTPPEAIYARITDERYRCLVGEAKRANINALRVWGGGIYSADTFYKLCDQEGILIWQDFMFACGLYPQDDEFLEQVRQEAEYIVKRLRGHSSLLVWCGDNENDWAHLWNNVPDYQSNKLNRVCLPEVCGRLDSDRPYIPSSPFSPWQVDPNSPLEGDVHLWKHGSSFRDDFYLRCHPRMVTEIGHLSLPNIEVIRSFIPEESLWPLDNEHWRAHCSDTIRMGWDNRLQTLFQSIANNGLSAPENLEELIQKTQHLQSEATRVWVEHFSSQPECWGVFLWNLCDCWPQLSDAYIAYPFSIKPALTVVREVYGKIKR